MENNSQPPAPAAPAKVTPPANEPPKTTQATSNHRVVPMAASTAATDGSAAQPQRGTVAGSMPLRSVQQHPQPSSRSLLQGSCSNKAVVATAGTGTGAMYGTTAQCGAAMPRSPTAVRSLACRPVQQTNPVVFGQGSSSSNQAMHGSSSTQAVAATALVAAMHGPTAYHGTIAQCGAAMPRSPTAVRSLACRPVQGSSSSNQPMQSSSSTLAVAATALAAATYGPTAQHGAAVPVPWWLPAAALFPAPRVVRPTKLMIMRPPAPPPPKLPVYRPPPPPRPELASSSAAGNALLPSSSDTGFRVSNMQADPPSPDQVTMAEEGSDSEGSGGSGDGVEMLDLNFPPVSNKEN